MRRIGFVALVLVSGVACRGGPTGPAGEALDEKLAERFADTVVDDLSWLATASEEIAQGAEDVPEDQRRSTSEACYQTFGDCDFCYQYTGNPLQGTFAAGPSVSPCSWSSALVSLEYTVDAAELQGIYGGSVSGDYTISATGSRTATVSASDRDYDASFSLDSLSVTTVAAALDSFSADMTYTAFGDEEWSLDVSGDAASISGTVTGPSYTCTVAASLDDADVACEAVE